MVIVVLLTILMVIHMATIIQATDKLRKERFNEAMDKARRSQQRREQLLNELKPTERDRLSRDELYELLRKEEAETAL